MAAKDIKLTAVLVDKVSAGLKMAGQDWRRAVEEPAKAATQTAKKEADKLTGDFEAAGKKRGALNITFLNQEEALQAKRVTSARAAANQIARAEYDLAYAQAGKTTERFERLKLIEDAANKLRLVKAAENHRLLELEAERHTAKLEAIEAQAGAFENTPFQKLLGHLGTLTGRKTNEIRESGEATLGLFGLEAEGPGMAAAGSEGAGMAALGGPAAMAATVAVGALAVGMFEAVKAGKEMRESQEAVESSLKASGREETLGAEALEKYASAIAATTKFSDNQARAAEGMLLPFRNLSDAEIPKLLMVSANLAAKMGLELPAAAKTLGLAFDNPEHAAKALREAGISLTAQEQKQIKSWMDMGETGKAHEFLFKRLEGALGDYAADTVHNTEIVGHKWEELSGKIGVQVLKIGDAIAGLVIKDKAAREFEEKALSGAFANYGDNAAAEMAKAGSAADKLQQGFQELADKQKAITESKSTAPEAEPIETGAQIEAEKKIQHEILKATAKGEQGKTQIAIAEEESRYQIQKEASLHSAREDEAIEKLHQAMLHDIKLEAAKKNSEVQIRVDDEVFQSHRTAQEKLRELAIKAAHDKQLIAEDELRTAKAYARQEAETKAILRNSDIATMDQGVDRKLEESKAREEAEVRAFNTSEQAKNMGLMQAEMVRTNISKKFTKEREDISFQGYQAEVMAASQFATNFGQAMTLLAGKNKALARTGMRITEAGAIANTAGGIMKAFDQGGVLGFLTGGAIAAAGATQVATIEQQLGKIGGYAGGTDYAPGGMAWVGERGPELVNLPRGSQVHTASESAQMARGGGGITHTGNVNITIQAAPGTSPAQAQDMGRQAAIGYREELQKWKKMEADAKYLGVTA